MKLKRRQLLLALGSTAVPGAVSATACAALARSQGDINLVGSSLPAIQHLARAAEGCSRTGLKVSFKITPPLNRDQLLSNTPQVICPDSQPDISLEIRVTPVGTPVQSPAFQFIDIRFYRTMHVP